MGVSEKIEASVEPSLNKADSHRLLADNALLKRQLANAGSKLIQRARIIQDLGLKVAALDETVTVLNGVIEDLRSEASKWETTALSLQAEVDRLKAQTPDAVYERARRAEERCEHLSKVVDAQDRLIRWRGDRIAELLQDPKEWR